MAAEIVAELESAVRRAPTPAEPRAGVAHKALILAIVAVQLAWLSALALALAFALR